MTADHDGSQLHRLMYASIASPDLKLADLTKILESSEENNPRDSITGALVYAEGFFLQYMEGPRDALSSTLMRISQDSRHSGICLIEFAGCQERQFDRWAMRHLEFQSDVLLAAMGTSSFEPLQWSADRCNAFFLKFSVLMDKG